MFLQARFKRTSANAYGYSIGKDKLALLESKTFPDIEKQVDRMFWRLKNELKK